MAKVGDIAKVSAKGSFHMLWGLVVSTIVMSVGMIFIARLLGSDQYGLYTIVVTVPMTIQIFRDWGMNSAMVKFTAQYRAEGRLDEIRSVYLTGILFEVVVGLALSFFSFFFADFLATSVFNRPVIAPLIQIISFCLFAMGLVAAATAVFTGYERLELNSLMLVLQNISKTAIIIILVVLGFGTSGAVIGYTAGLFIAGMIGVALIGLIYRQLPKPSSRKLELKAYFTAMLTYCLPLSFATVITLLLPQFYAFMLPIHYLTDNVIIGNYGVAMNFVVLITFFTIPISTTMFPAFSKLDPEKDIDSLRDVFRFSAKYGSLILLPMIAIVMSLSETAVATLFGNSYDTAGILLSLMAIPYAFMAFGNLSLNALLNGQGKTSFVLRVALVTGLICFPLGYVSILTFGIWGLILTSIVAKVPIFVMKSLYVKRTYGFTVDFGSLARILISSTVAGAVTYFAVSELVFTAWIELLLGVGLFIVVVVPALLLSRSITRFDLANLKLMTGGLGVIGALIGKVINLLDRLMTLFRL